MSDTTIRCARCGDSAQLVRMLREIARIHHKGRPDLFKPSSSKYNEEQVAAMINDSRHAVFVAEDLQGRLCGYIFCKFHQEEEGRVTRARRFLYIDDLYVDESQRGRHIGVQLLDRAIEAAREQECAHVELNVWNFNQSAVRFYEAQGFDCRKLLMERKL